MGKRPRNDTVQLPVGKNPPKLPNNALYGLMMQRFNRWVASQARVTTKDNGDGTYTHTFNFTKGT